MNFKTRYRHTRKYLKPALLVLMIVVFVSSCSTKKNTFLNRTYHNLTSHFNVYWNGNTTLQEGYSDFRKTVKDNYTTILPVYNIGSLQEAGQMSSAADRALEKGSATIQRHSIYTGGKERVKWIDDAYMVIGQAYFFKREYNSAARTFEFVMTNYDDPNVIFNARLWLINTLDRSGKFNLSATEMELARLAVTQKKVTKRKYLSFYNETIANHYIITKEYELALPYLKDAIQYAQSGKMRQRLQFISGQIYQHLGNCQKANEYYSILLKKNTTHDIGFNSRINLAKCSAVNSGDQREIIRQLEKMLKETKNKEYQDQIYYALYEVARAAGNVQKEKEYLKLSVATSTQNDYQKSLSALTLADILFEDQEYENSQAYYDTTLQVLPRDYPGYDDINKRGAILSDLVFNLVTIRDQDSLQMVADMSEKDRNAHIDAIIQKIIEEEQRIQEEERRIAELGYRDPRDVVNPNAASQGGWYFYNPQALSTGRREFMRKYGNRKLEDLWIISNKQSFNWDRDDSSGEVALGPDGQPIDTTLAVTDVKKREYYMQFLPLTPEARFSSDSIIAIAYFNVGSIYREQLGEIKKSADAFQNLVERYPDTTINKSLLLSYYFLIKSYEQLGDAANQQKYTNLLLQKYPNSDMARLILDPDYHKDLMEKAKSVEMLYEKTYLAYKGEQHYLVLLNAEKAATDFPNHELMPKFDFLKAMSSGKLESQDSTVAQLTRLVMKYPSSDIKPRAEQVITALTGEKFEYVATDSTGAVIGGSVSSIYNTDNLNGRHFLVVYLPDAADMSPMKIRFLDFNTQNYKMNNYTVNGVLTPDGKHAIVSVGLFNNKETGMAYYHHVITDAYIMSLATKQQESEIFLISDDNYPILYQDGDMKKYKEFFQKNYLSK